MWILCFVCCLFSVSFSLSYLPFTIDLGKAGSLASWFVSFFPQPRSTLALVCSCRVCKALPASATSTSLSAKTDIAVSVPFVVPNHGKKLQRRKLSHVQSFRVAHFRHVTQRYFVFSVIVFSFQIVTMVLLKHMLHLVKKTYFSESY